MGENAARADKACSLIALFKDFRRNDSGATAIEYGLIVALIFLAIVGAVRSYTNSTSDMYGTIEETLEDASS